MRNGLLAVGVLVVGLGCATTGGSTTAASGEGTQRAAATAAEGAAASTGGEAAATGEATASKDKKPEAGNPDEVVCVSQAATGSRYPKRTCTTRRQMALDREKAQGEARAIDRAARPN